MVRWIVFDDDTAETVVGRLRRGAAEIEHTYPLDAALNNPGASLVILPSRFAGRLLVARFSAHKAAAASPRTPVPAAPAAPVASAKKVWWRKLVA